MRTIVQSFPYVTGYVNALKALCYEAYEWDEQYKPAFDLFAEFQPQLFICRSDLSYDLIKCFHKYKPVVFCYLHERLNQDVVPYVHTFITSDSNFNMDFDKRLKYVPPGFDSIRYKPTHSLGLTYVGDFRPELDWILKATQETPIKIFGANWPLRSVGRYLDQTEANALSGTSICFEGIEKVLKILGCGGTPIIKHTDELERWFGHNLFNTYDEMIRLINKPKKFKIDIEEHTYISRIKELISE